MTEQKLKESIDQKTNLAGENRMELLIFSLSENGQKFGINVFKVREVIPTPEITPLPHSGKDVLGISNIRGEVMPVIDIGSAIGMTNPVDIEDQGGGGLVIITEYNRKTQGFLIRHVDRILNQSWKDIETPPKGFGDTDNYLTAITKINDSIISILDVEEILEKVVPQKDKSIPESAKNEEGTGKLEGEKVLIIDDSKIARKQLVRCLESLGAEYEQFENGKDAYDRIQSIIGSGVKPEDHFYGIICDIEMPIMDGYSFTKEMKGDQATKEVPIILHSSLSGVFNESLVSKVGADSFVAKFKPEELVEGILGISKSPS